MKEKIKKFYEEHKTECILTVSAVLAATAAVVYHNHTINGAEVEGIQKFTREDGTETLVAFRKDGRTATFKQNW